MGGELALGQLLTGALDQFSLGMAMFGSHAIWISALPLIWMLAACLIWIKAEEDEAAREDRYIANMERNLPKLRELAMKRSTEILEVRPIKRDVIR